MNLFTLSDLFFVTCDAWFIRFEIWVKKSIEHLKKCQKIHFQGFAVMVSVQNPLDFEKSKKTSLTSVARHTPHSSVIPQKMQKWEQLSHV